MKIEDGKRILEPGDRIYCRGIIVTIKKISHQDDFGDEGFDIEYWDRKGSLRSWKQRFDEGFVLNDSPVPMEIRKEVINYFESSLPQYVPILVKRASEHPEDHYLYMVLAEKKGTGEYATWTSYNSSRKCLNHGHYGLSVEAAINLLNEHFHKINGKVGDK